MRIQMLFRGVQNRKARVFTWPQEIKLGTTVTIGEWFGPRWPVTILNNAELAIVRQHLAEVTAVYRKRSIPVKSEK